MPDDLLVPEATRLLHIGPYKTGSTALQRALHDARDDLREQGVEYAGRRSQEVSAAAWVVGRPMPHHDPKEGEARWHALTEGIRASTAKRVVLSSEFLSDARPDAITRVVDDLGPHVHVAVTLRPLANILPSQWQQYVLRGLTVSYEDWLAAIFDDRTSGRVTPTFWHRHRHHELVERWASVVGPENVSVVILDPSDHSFLASSFERLLGLRHPTLRLSATRQNRSLSRPETEVLREFNRQFTNHGFARAEHVRLLRNGASFHLRQRTPTVNEPRIATPAWALARASEIGDQIASGLVASGVRIIGSPSLLADTPPAAPTTDQTPIPAEAAARLAMGLVIAHHKLMQIEQKKIRADLSITNIRSRDLLEVLAGRLKRRLTCRGSS